MISTGRIVAGMSLWLCLSACSQSTAARANLTDRVRARYADGMDELVAGNYTEAISAFQAVVKSPGYIKYAALARLRIGDALFLQEKFDAAIEHYRSFVKRYPNDPNAGYARFRIGHAFYEQIPADWFLAPPTHERQQHFVRQAAAALSRFTSLYPTHPLVGKARTLLADCQRKLYAHELYVARFYYDRDKPAAVVQRLEAAFREFPDLSSSEENYVMLAQAYARTESIDRATATYEAYLDRFPSGDYVKEARESLRVLRSNQEVKK